VTAMRWVMPYWADQTQDEAIPVIADNLSGIAALNRLALFGRLLGPGGGYGR
jgi:hypothetical protein